MNDFRYQLEKYQGRGNRYICPQCGRKYTFTRYIDTHNNNEYINERVGKCNRLDKCGYHYIPKLIRGNGIIYVHMFTHIGFVNM